MPILPGAVALSTTIPQKSPTVGLSIVFLNNGARDTATVTRVYVGGDPYNMLDLRVTGEPHDRTAILHENTVKVGNSIVGGFAWNFS